MHPSPAGSDAAPTHHDAGPPTPGVALRTAAQAEAMVVATVQAHADDLLRVARRYSLCPDDAHEAYGRALEIYVRHARRLDAAGAHRWLFTVLKHEALAVRRQRGQLLGADEPELDRLEARTTDSPEDRALAADDVGRAAAALRRLKPDELRALWLKASGLSYAEIMEQTGWTYTKVNRCLAEGRSSLARHLTAIESGADCEQFLPLLSRLLDGEASRKELRPLRTHLKACGGCRSELRALRERGAAIRVVLPSGVLAGVAGPVAEADVPGALGRLYDAVATAVQERATLSAIKLQAAVEVAASGKVAAVAASAAAVAGGGMVAATEAADRGPAAGAPAIAVPAARADVPARPAPTVAVRLGTGPPVPFSGSPAAAPALASRAAGPPGSARAMAASERLRPRPQAPERAHREFDPPAGAPAASAPARTSGSAAAAGGEFAGVGAGSAGAPAAAAAPAGAPAPAAGPAPATPAPPSTPSSAAAAAAEFTP